MKNNIGIFNACDDIPVEIGFNTISAAINYIKMNWTYAEWNELEYSLNVYKEDETGSAIEYLEQINPFE